MSIIKAIDSLAGAVTPSPSVAAAIGGLKDVNFQNGDAAVAEALGPTGNITTAIAAAFTEHTAENVEALGEEPEEGDIADTVNAIITALITAGLMADEG